MEYENLEIKKEHGLGWIVINYPPKLNALNAKTTKELKAAFLALKTLVMLEQLFLQDQGQKPFWKRERLILRESKGEQDGDISRKTSGKGIKNWNCCQPL